MLHGDNSRLQEDKWKVPSALLRAEMEAFTYRSAEEGTLTGTASYKQKKANSTEMQRIDFFPVDFSEHMRPFVCVNQL